MLCPYLRSSSINQFKACEMKYTLEYLFGMKCKSGKKAVLGTIFHRCFELRGLAGMAKKAGKSSFVDSDLGELSVKRILDNEKNLDLCFDYYTKIEAHHKYTNSDKKTIANWIEATLRDYPQYDPVKLDIIATEQYFDIEIPDDWARFEGVVDGQEVSGQLSIKGTMDKIVRITDEVYELVDYKGLPVGTPIPTPEGWSTMGDLKVGDMVFDRFGKQTKVVAKSTQKFKECYRITFDDMSTVECDDEHYWTLSSDSVLQVLDLKLGDKIDVAKPIDCNEKELPIDPYVLGVSLGNSNNDDCETKSIPESYFRASYYQRLDLLRGLMSSGSVGPPQNDVKKLLLTLGQKSSLGNGYPDKRTIKKIEKIGKKLTQCISVDSPDKTYLCTEHLIPTHNTGQRREDFATGEEKDLAYFENDIQLLLYLIAMRHLWPDKELLLTLFYINKGGMFTVHGDDAMYDRAKQMLKDSFKKIGLTNRPKQLDPYHKDWRCKYCCDFSKPHENGGQSICQFYKGEIERMGLQPLQDKLIDIGKLLNYQDGGGRKAE